MLSFVEELENRRLLSVVSVRGRDIYLDGVITHESSQLEGTLPNIRAVNATFDDENPATVDRWAYPNTGDWNRNRNTRELINALPDWREAGVLAATLSFQGGGPVDSEFGTRQPWKNSAFNSYGDLKEGHLNRMERTIRALDGLGMVAIVNFFYLGQEWRIGTEEAVLNAAENATRWLVSKGFSNVIIDAVNESSSFYRTPILEPQNVHQLIAKIHEWSDGRLLVGTSFLGGALPTSEVASESDVIFLHGNGQKPWKINSMVDAMRARTNKPVLFNEDSTSLSNFREASRNGASWGYYDQGRNDYENGFQSLPIDWSLEAAPKQAFASEVQRLSRPDPDRSSAVSSRSAVRPAWSVFAHVPLEKIWDEA
jgi:hypothetical protein